MDFIAVLAAICAFIVKGMSGFANTLVFDSIMSFTASNINITPVELLVGYPSNFYIAWKERKGISLKVCIPLALFVMIGIIPGAIFLLKGDTGLIKTLFGFVVILLGIEMLLRERQKHKKKTSKATLALIGIISGILCGLFGIGAFLVAYISRTTDNQTQFKSNICIVFLVENTFRIVFYSMTGILSLAIIKQAALLLPFMAAGLAIGMLLSRKVSEGLVRKAVIILLILSGISLVINNMRIS
jgi:uncharacterized membrane protein YfcA